MTVNSVAASSCFVVGGGIRYIAARCSSIFVRRGRLLLLRAVSRRGAIIKAYSCGYPTRQLQQQRRRRRQRNVCNVLACQHEVRRRRLYFYERAQAPRRSTSNPQSLEFSAYRYRRYPASVTVSATVDRPINGGEPLSVHGNVRRQTIIYRADSMTGK